MRRRRRQTRRDAPPKAAAASIESVTPVQLTFLARFEREDPSFSCSSSSSTDDSSAVDAS